MSQRRHVLNWFILNQFLSQWCPLYTACVLMISLRPHWFYVHIVVGEMQIKARMSGKHFKWEFARLISSLDLISLQYVIKEKSSEFYEICEMLLEFVKEWDIEKAIDMWSYSIYIMLNKSVWTDWILWRGRDLCLYLSACYVHLYMCFKIQKNIFKKKKKKSKE